jgi:hypothetical protein
VPLVRSEADVVAIPPPEVPTSTYTGDSHW